MDGVGAGSRPEADIEAVCIWMVMGSPHWQYRTMQHLPRLNKPEFFDSTAMFIACWCFAGAVSAVVFIRTESILLAAVSFLMGASLFYPIAGILSGPWVMPPPVARIRCGVALAALYLVLGMIGAAFLSVCNGFSFRYLLIIPAALPALSALTVLLLLLLGVLWVVCSGISRIVRWYGEEVCENIPKQMEQYERSNQVPWSIACRFALMVVVLPPVLIAVCYWLGSRCMLGGGGL